MIISEIREQLLSEHDDLRKRAAEVRGTLRRWEQGEAIQTHVRGQLLALADAIRAHNTHEEQAIGRIVRKPAREGAGAGLMDEEHLKEHVDLLAVLTSSAVAAEPAAWQHLVDQLLVRLLDHMAREERAFLNAQVLHDDGGAVEG
jgi:hypothetical protein